MQRRDFLKLAGFFMVAAHAPIHIMGCGSSNARAARGAMAFLHGVASGDPRESSIVLWTRVTPLDDTAGYVVVNIQLASDENFDSLIVDSSVKIDEGSDYTLRFLISDLSSDTVYYYRFIANNELTSTIGRTWTAPHLNSDTPIHFASVNCQNREHGFYSAYAHMLQEDLLKSRDEQIRFVLHLGDFIYETRNDALQRPLNELGEHVDALIDTHGEERRITPFAHGGILQDGTEYAVTLNDYRHLYKSYLLDPDLQAARARWPFICVWDDHEFTDDCWQTEANYADTGIDSSTNEPSQQRKLAANQAWYEYIPVDYSANPFLGDIPHYSQPFQRKSVGTTENNNFDDDGLANNADNLAALDSLTIYRSLRFGANLQLVLTDCRSYRSDHAMPEDISGNFQDFFHSRMALPLSLINILDAGREANGGQSPVLLDPPVALRNPRMASPAGTMLGKKQKQWWKQVFSQSNTRWKVWGNSVPLMRLGIDVSALGTDYSDIILSSDTWDGYNSERRELLTFLYENNINNVVSITGDVHAYYAGKVLIDFDNKDLSKNFSIPEFICGAVSSITQFAALNQLSYRENPDEIETLLRQLIVYSDKTTGDSIVNFNTSLLRGAATALIAAQNADRELPVPATVAPMNPHLNYVDTDAKGYSLYVADSENFNAKFIAVDSTIVDPLQRMPQTLRQVDFNVTAQDSAGDVIINGPHISGVRPYPFV